MNQLILGDNLEILKSLESETIDLIYLDPPFFSNRNYEVIWGDAGEIRSFQDRWSGGIDHYIAWLKERVFEMHRLLKPTGSIFLHCDWHADAYVRVLILDKIFGAKNFKNIIVWHYKRWPAKQKNFQRMHDSIFFYAKNVEQVTFNLLYDELSEGTQRRWKGKKSKVEFEEGKRLVTKMTDDDSSGRLMDDVWDIAVINSQAKERIGYPTQKPEKLLERIILATSNENDVILDPFVGGGTTVAVADKLKRNWIGIDQSVQAIKVSEMRLQKHQDLFSNPFVVQLHKYDYDTLRYQNAFAFESWIIQQLGGTPNTKQRNDLGIDGRDKTNLPIQVKRSDNIGREVIDKFQSACKRFDNNLFEKQRAENLPVGILIAFSFGKGAIQEIARLKNEENTIIQLLKVEEIVPIAKKPKLTVIFTDLGLDSKNLRDIEFTAQGESDAGIEFYAWDFSYQVEEGFKADVLIDKIGKQIEKFKVGAHTIAVKVVDNEGLESLEVLHLKINGVVK
jgi:DNA modification methylase